MKDFITRSPPRILHILLIVSVFAIIFFHGTVLSNPDFVSASDSIWIAPARPKNSSHINTLTFEKAQLTTSNLKLILTGTIVGKNGWALIKVFDHKEELFAVGQMISSGVFLISVNWNYVVISHDGILEILEMHSRAKSQEATLIKSDPPVVHNQPQPEEPNQGQRRYANKLFEAPDLLKIGRITPVANGVQVNDISTGSLYEQMGFKDGDIIRTINDMQVSSLSDYVNFIQQRNNTDRLQIGVVRYGDLYNLQYDPELGLVLSMPGDIGVIPPPK